MATELFPTSIMLGSVKVTGSWDVLITQLGTAGKETRHLRSAFPTRDIRPSFSWLSGIEIALIWQFYQARKGPFEAFHFIDPLLLDWYAEYVGLGDAAEDTFDLPSLSTVEATLAVYVDAVLKAGGGVDYTFSPGSGENGADQIVFTVPPAVGAVITADFTGKHRFLVRFKDRTMTREWLSVACYNSEFGFQEVLPE